MADNWRDKYLQLLEQQELDEGRFQKQQELLRQAVIQLALAAEGQDSELNEQLSRLRQSLRKGYDRPGEVRLIQLDDQLRAFDHRRDNYLQSVSISLQELTQQLRGLELPRVLNKNLGTFQRQLKARTQEVSFYPQILEEFNKLQRQCIQQIMASDEHENSPAEGSDTDATDIYTASGEGQKQKPSLLTRWFRTNDSQDGDNKQQDATKDDSVRRVDGDRESNTRDGHASESSVNKNNASENNPSDSSPNENNTAGSGSADSGNDSRQTDTQDAELILSGDLVDGLHEPAFSHISERVSRILTALLDSVNAEECVRNKVEETRRRIAAGLNWFELVPALEDIHDLVMQAYLAADRNFSVYLQGVNAELKAITELLGDGIAQHSQLHIAADDLHSVISGQLILAEESISSASEIDQLKAQLESQIGTIRQSLESFADQREQTNLTEHLQRLLGKVNTLELQAQNHQAELEGLKQKALIDHLTQLPNREAWADHSYSEYQRWQRYGRPLVLAVIDIDLFKRVNDQFGHQAGDRVLQVIAKAIHKRLRDVDFFARYGGEEFALLLPETSLENGMLLLNKIRESIAAAAFHFKKQPINITVSIGASSFAQNDTVENVFGRADKALYQAKAQGRNRCESMS